MVITYTIYYSLEDNIYLIYIDSFNQSTDFNCGDYSLTINSYLIYFIICYKYSEKDVDIYVGSCLYLTKRLIEQDYIKYRLKPKISIKIRIKTKLINVLLRLLYKLGYKTPQKSERRRFYVGRWNCCKHCWL